VVDIPDAGCRKVDVVVSEGAARSFEIFFLAV
jgi:hypothetical protein